MKIAFLMTQSLDSPSGLGRYGPIARELDHLGHTVEIIALHHDWKHLQQKSSSQDRIRVNYV